MMDETEVERSAAMKGLMRWVRLHPYNISQKVQVVVEHFRENVQPLLMGHPRPWWWWGGVGGWAASTFPAFTVCRARRDRLGLGVDRVERRRTIL